MELENIVVEDFSSFQPGRVAPHVKIEQLLTQVGGGGSDGIKFTKRIIKAAGWRYPKARIRSRRRQPLALFVMSSMVWKIRQR